MVICVVAKVNVRLKKEVIYPSLPFTGLYGSLLIRVVMSKSNNDASLAH